jgi:hypothetical protein
MAVSSPDLKAFLVATPFFGGLSDASLDLLLSMLNERRFEAGATVIAEVIELARTGERDSNRMRESALHDLRG